MRDDHEEDWLPPEAVTARVWEHLTTEMDANASVKRVMAPPSPRWTGRTGSVGMAVAAAAIMVLVLRGGALMHRATRHFIAGTQYTTVSGQRLTATLPDGTRLTLGPASHITLSAAYASGEREIQLEGEGYFSVVHDTQHPFAVFTRGIAVRDVGTEFDVRAYDDDIRVAVAEGSVALVGAGRGNGAIGYLRPSMSSGTVSRTRPSLPTTNLPSLQEIPPSVQEIPLSAGDMAQVHNGEITVAHHVDIAELTGWLQGHLTFHRTPLVQVVQEVSRTFGLHITVADSGLAAHPITGSFANESATEVLNDLVGIIGGRYEQRGSAIVITSLKRNADDPPSSHAVPLTTVQGTP